MKHTEPCAARTGKARNAYRVSVAKTEGKIQRERPRRRWECSIKRDLEEIGWKGVDWIDLAQDKDKWPDLARAVIKLRVPQNEGNCSNS